MNTTLKVLIVYYIIINICLFVMMYIDKMRAKKNSWRIPESTLFIIALLGGAIGGFLGMFVFHHKNRKPHFYIIYAIAIMLHISLIYFIMNTFLKR